MKKISNNNEKKKKNCLETAGESPQNLWGVFFLSGIAPPIPHRSLPQDHKPFESKTQPFNLCSFQVVNRTSDVRKALSTIS